MCQVRLSLSFMAGKQNGVSVNKTENFKILDPLPSEINWTYEFHKPNINLS